MNIDINRVMEASMGDENIGFCTSCGFEQSCVEPDASGYTCESCGEKTIEGADTFLITHGQC